MLHRRVIALAMLTTLLLAVAGCARVPDTGVNPPSPNGQTGVLATLTDEQLIARYIEGLDIALVGNTELIFGDARIIPSQTLYMFFVHATYQDNLYSPDDWLNKTDNKYHVPLDVVSTTIDKYFDGARFDPAEVDCYVPASKEFVTPVFGGFGGGRFIKLRQKETLTADRIRLTADFYDGENFGNVVYTKIYTIQITAGGYKYLSIIRP